MGKTIKLSEFEKRTSFVFTCKSCGEKDAIVEESLSGILGFTCDECEEWHQIEENNQ